MINSFITFMSVGLSSEHTAYTRNNLHRFFQLLILWGLLCFAVVCRAETLKPFTSDGCSAFPDGTFSQNTLWLSCCVQHDFEYWKGGTYEQRLQSDKALTFCVSKVGEPKIAALMLAGVRVGGTPYLPTSFRWGYGWAYPKFYGALTENELQQVKQLTPKKFTHPSPYNKL